MSHRAEPAGPVPGREEEVGELAEPEDGLRPGHWILGLLSEITLASGGELPPWERDDEEMAGA